MKDLLSKEHYCYKIHVLLMTNTAYPSYIRHLLYGLPPPSPPPNFYNKILCPSSVILQNLNPL